MRTKTAQWFEVIIRFDKMMDNGMLKQVSEQYVVEALSFTEAEARIIKESEPYISGDFVVDKIVRAPFREAWLSDSDSDDRYFKAKLQFITLDEKTQKEKKQTVCYLVQAKDFDGAKKAVEDTMNTTMIDYVIASITETRILDVFEV